MAKIQVNGFIHNVYQEKQFDGANGKVRVQDVLIRVPAYRDDFGVPRGEDEIWPMVIFGDKIDKLKLTGTPVDTKVKAVVFVNAKLFYKKEDVAKTEPLYGLQAVLSEIVIVP